MKTSLLLPEPPLQVIPSLAVKIGLNEAIIIQQIHYWLQLSTHEIDGYKWIYNPIREWEKQFPFWGKNTIIRALESLKKKDLVITGNFNKLKMDKTLWYRIDYNNPILVYDLPKNRNAIPNMGESSTQNGYITFTQNGYTNTRDYTETTTEINTPPTPQGDGGGKKTSSKPKKKKYDVNSPEVDKLYSLYPRKAGCHNAKLKIAAALNNGMEYVELEKAVEEYANCSYVQTAPKQKIPHPATWFNQRRWEDDRSEWNTHYGSNKTNRFGEKLDYPMPGE